MNPEEKKDILTYLREGRADFIPQLSINCVIFGFTGTRLMVLATQPAGTGLWLVPGNFVDQQESINQSAYRAVSSQLGLDQIFLRQFKTFGEANRSFAGEMADYFAESGIDGSLYEWMVKRFVTIGYYACADFRQVQPIPSLLFQDIRWVDIYDVDLLDFDHAKIVREARKTLAKDLLDLPVIAKLLPETFTIPELQKLHEAILGREIDRGNFRQKILKTGILEKVGERHTPSTRRPPGLYRFNRNRYEALLEEEVKIGF